jgi:hypothetical protein
MAWLPSYLGSWDQLVNTLLHDPTIGSGRGGVHHVTHANDFAEMRHPDLPPPRPWSFATSYLLAAISGKVAAEGLTDGPQKQGVISRADGAIRIFLDDICGTPPQPWPFPWPWPGPGPSVMPLVSELTLLANMFQDGALRQELQRLASQLLERALASTGVGNPA